MKSIAQLGQVAVFSPLLGFFLGSVAVRYQSDRFAQICTCALLFIASLAGVFLFNDVVLNQSPLTIPLFLWFEVDSFSVSWGMKLDTLSVTMIVVVTAVSFLVHVYSVGYMSHDKSIPRFMAYLSLFTFMMLMLVTAPNLVQMFFGWEGVGLASYLLIGFWYERSSANAAAMKAFIVNRVGDIGLALGIFAIYVVFQTVAFDDIFTLLPEVIQSHEEGRPMFFFFNGTVDALNLIGILLFIGAVGKSAQLGLHTWLPDAMEGPTPVSALIHAATMVTAGVFMVARLSPLYEMAPLARDIITIVGALTAFFAATIALTQTDIKRVIAYSTCSQLGYMFFAAGCSAYNAAIFHLVTHAFFKALLFLGAGSVIHAMSDEQNMTKMGGIYQLIPKTYVVMWIGSMALAGIPLFAGYYSKDAILESAYLSGTSVGQVAFVLGLCVAFMTAFYSWRLLLITFHGTPKADEVVMSHVHESPLSMLIPLGLLSIGAIFSGYIGHNLFIGESAVAFWGGSIALTEKGHDHLPLFITLLPLVFAVLGIIVAYFCYEFKKNLPEILSQKFQILYQLFYRKWFIDEIYNKIFINSAFGVGQVFWKKGDSQLIDGLGPDGVTFLSLKISGLTSRLQTGYVYHYAFAMLIGIVLMISWCFYIKMGI